MYLERLTLTNFRCFGGQPTTIEFGDRLTAFVGANGVGKTATMLALQRLFAPHSDLRRIQKKDFHIPKDEAGGVDQRKLRIDAILAFPELDSDPDSDVIPEFFHNMAAADNGCLKCRLVLDAIWEDDGSADGDIQTTYDAVTTFGEITDGDRRRLRPLDRARVQLVYVPASRDGASQVTAFLRGRLWRAIKWSKSVQEEFRKSADSLTGSFESEDAIQSISAAVVARWKEVHDGGTDTTPNFRLLNRFFPEFVQKVEVVFSPDEEGRERPIAELSDGQRSLLHLAMTATTLDVERAITEAGGALGFESESGSFPSLTIVAVEEPEQSCSVLSVSDYSSTT